MACPLEGLVGRAKKRYMPLAEVSTVNSTPYTILGLFCLLASATFCALPLGRDIRFWRSWSLTCCSTLNVTLIKPDLLAGISSHGLRSLLFQDSTGYLPGCLWWLGRLLGVLAA